MTVALINTKAANERGKFATEADARKWLDTVEVHIDPAAVAAGEYVVEPVAELDGPHITISLEIENTYEEYDDVTTDAENIVIPVPPADDCESWEWDDWFQDHIVGWSGYGRPDGDSWYDFTVTASSDETIIAVGTTYDWGY